MDFAAVSIVKTEDFGLLDVEESDDPQASIAGCDVDLLIDNCNDDKTRLYTFILAMGNAADAVEIICVGYILSEMDDATTQNKGSFLPTLLS